MTDHTVPVRPAQVLPDLSGIGDITPSFRHDDKLVTVGDGLSLPNAYLKWYDIRRPQVGEIPVALGEESRVFLRTEVAAGRLDLSGQFGFVELHHCTTVAFLLVFTWTNDNELWEAHYIKDLDADGSFRRFDVHNGAHRPMNCVWELAPVWHERQAWVRYLRSAHDAEAKRAYLTDRYTGLC